MQGWTPETFERPDWLEEPPLYDTTTPGWRDIKPRLPAAARPRPRRPLAESNGQHQLEQPTQALSWKNAPNNHGDPEYPMDALDGMHAPLPGRINPGLPSCFRRTYGPGPLSQNLAEALLQAPGVTHRPAPSRKPPGDDWADRNAWVLGGAFTHLSGPWDAYRPPVPPKGRNPWQPLKLVRDEMAKERSKSREEKGKGGEVDEKTCAKVEEARQKRAAEKEAESLRHRAVLRSAEDERKAAMVQRVALFQARAAKREGRNRRHEEWRWQKWAPHTSPRHRAAPPPKSASSYGRGGSGSSSRHRAAPPPPPHARPHTARASSLVGGSSRAAPRSRTALAWAEAAPRQPPRQPPRRAREAPRHEEEGFDLLSADLAALAEAHLEELAEEDEQHAEQQAAEHAAQHEAGFLEELRRRELLSTVLAVIHGKIDPSQAFPTLWEPDAPEAKVKRTVTIQSPKKEVLGERLLQQDCT